MITKSEKTTEPSTILVYGSRGGGTYMALSLIDGFPNTITHPGEVKLKSYARSPEFHFLKYSSRSTLWQVLADAGFEVKPSDFEHNSGKFSVAFKLLDEELNQLVKVWSKITGNTYNGQTLIFKEAGGDPKSVVCNFLTACPEGKILFVSRDPVDCVYSIIRKRAAAGKKISLKILCKEIIEAVYVQKVINELSENTLITTGTVRYEKLCTQPNKELKNFTKLLGSSNKITEIDGPWESSIFGVSKKSRSDRREQRCDGSYHKRRDINLIHQIFVKIGVSIVKRTLYSPN